MLDVFDMLDSPDASVVIPAPGRGPGFWAGGPSALAVDGAIWLAYRLRRPVDQGRGYANVVARSVDGITFEPVATVTSAQFDCASLERPALVHRPDGGWRLYVSCSTLNSKHWWVEAVDSDTPEGLATGTRTVVLPGDDSEAWKDVVVHAAAGDWHMWACRHPLDGGDDAADRMSTWYATSRDGLSWTMVGEALRPEAESWQARGTRVAHVAVRNQKWWAIYDGRRTAEENWVERSGLASGDRPDALIPVAGPVPAEIGRALRYATVVELDGACRVYFEATAADGSHDLRTVYVPRPSGANQSE